MNMFDVPSTQCERSIRGKYYALFRYCGFVFCADGSGDVEQFCTSGQVLSLLDLLPQPKE